MNSKQKGKRGELEFAQYLSAQDLPARRGQQFRGGGDSPDVVCKALPTIHFEVKRTERLGLTAALEQAVNDAAPGKVPVVAHKKNRGFWIAILPMNDLLGLIRDQVQGFRR